MENVLENTHARVTAVGYSSHTGLRFEFFVVVAVGEMKRKEA